MAVGIGMKINAAKTQFFDRAVTSRVDPAKRKVLSKFGAFTATRAKRSIRQRKKTSPPGKPPHSHTGLLRRFIFFAYEPNRESVVIGPALLNRRKNGRALELLEYGGEVKGNAEVAITEKTRDKRGRSSVNRRRIKVDRRVYQPRPFMGPAFEAEKAASLPDIWKDSIR